MWEDAQKALDDYSVRKELAQTLLGFCAVYMPHYLTLPQATYHPDMLAKISDRMLRFLLILGHRGSAKSTYSSLALPIWAALEKPEEYPFILPTADTALQAATNIANIKNELDNNELLKLDYGKPNKKGLFTLESEEEWQAKNMLLGNGVRILARSRGQKVRGLRHRQHRPKLVIVDDPEDLEWVRTKTNRDKTERWLRGEVIPGIDERNGRLVLIGNLLHTDALLARLEADPSFQTMRLPLIKDGKTTWPAKYPTQADIDKQRAAVGEIAWQREYLLKVVPEEGQDVTEEDIQYYDTIPSGVAQTATSIDLAISKKETADYTAMLTGSLHIDETGHPKIYLHPYPINVRFGFKETIEQAKAIHAAQPGLHQFFVENVAYQAAAIEELERSMLPVVPFKPTTDKRARLRVTAPYIKNGTVLFPKQGCEDLIMQMLGFGIEEHDDLLDALTQLVLGLVDQGLQTPEVVEII